MFRIDDSTAATSLPTPESAGTEGYFTEGNPTAGTPATNVRGSWLNMIQEELCAILSAAGISRSKTTYNQVNNALQKMYSPVVGTVRNLSMTVTTASASAALTADQIVVASALNGQTYILPSFSKTINLATTGAGGMDTGTAPVSGYVALYAIYNPTTGASALLSTNATSAKVPEVYGGSNMPAGYTASALVGVWPTNASSQFTAGDLLDRTFSHPSLVTVLTATGSGSTNALTALNIASAVPKNAGRVHGVVSVTNCTSSNDYTTIAIAGNANGLGQVNVGGSASPSVGPMGAYRDMRIPTPQALYYAPYVAGASTITITYLIHVNGYTF